MWLILQAQKPEDFVIATGVQYSVREFAQLAFHYVGIELKWEGKEVNEKGICVSGPDALVGKTLVEISPDFYRLIDVVNLWGNPQRLRLSSAGIQTQHHSRISLRSWLIMI